MKHSWLAIVTTLLVGTACSTRAFGQTVTQAERGPAVARAAAEKSYARIAILRPHDGDTIDFEAGYTRHLAWHQQAKNTWVW